MLAQVWATPLPTVPESETDKFDPTHRPAPARKPFWPDAQPRDTVLFIAAAVVVVWIHRKGMFNRATAVTEVIPAGPRHGSPGGHDFARHRPDLHGLLLVLALFEAPGMASDFQAALDTAQQEFGFPRSTAAYVLSDGTVGVAATGLADLEAGTPMAGHSRRLFASIGKTFVAATALALDQK